MHCFILLPLCCDVVINTYSTMSKKQKKYKTKMRKNMLNTSGGIDVVLSTDNRVLTVPEACVDIVVRD